MDHDYGTHKRLDKIIVLLELIAVKLGCELPPKPEPVNPEETIWSILGGES